MELWQLRTFSIVAKTLHFTRAAEELNLSQPAVSHQIKSLEDELGEPLFIRDKDGIVLTKVGKTLFEHATKILDIADEMRMEIEDNVDSLSGKVVLGVATRGLGNPLAVFIEEFRETHNRINLTIHNEYEIDDIIRGVRNGKIDIGMVVPGFNYDGLELIPYGEYERWIVVGRNHPLATHEKVTIEDLQNQDWVTFEPKNFTRATIREFVKKFGIVSKTVFETNDGALIRSMVTNGNKISILPEWGIYEELKDGRIIALKVKEFRSKTRVELVWRKNRRTKSMSAVLTSLLKEKLEGIHLTDSEN